jgi:hypothetical protein
MARPKLCFKCGRRFTAAKYELHKFTHLYGQGLQRVTVDPATSRLLPIVVPEDDIVMEEDVSEVSTRTRDQGHAADDDPFSDDYEAAAGSSTYHYASFVDTPQPPLLSVSGDEEMDLGLSPSHSGDSLGKPTSIQPSLSDEGVEFEDSSLDPISTGHPSLSEQIKERFLSDYHGGGRSH